MYEVKVYHLTPSIRRGDLEEDFVLESSTVYKTRREAKESIESVLNRQDKKLVRRNYHRGAETSYCRYFTGKSWQNENSGETNDEYYEFQLRKLFK